MSRYFEELDVDKLFDVGASDFRLDPIANRSICSVLQEAEWYMPSLPEGMKKPEFLPDAPMACFSEDQKKMVRDSLQSVLEDEVLFRSFGQFGKLQVNEVEAFNGSIDEGWHHDGLAGRRGHAGDFFLLIYLDPKGVGNWDVSWGGSFDIGVRTLGDNWVHKIDAPETFESLYPQPRACVLGWNGNPRLVHRAAPLRAPVDRFVVAASVRLLSSAAR
jgi:hypothetical protein